MSKTGLGVNSQIETLAREYEARVTASLSAAERGQLERLLEKLGAAARGL